MSDSRAHQLVLDLTLRPALEAEDFIVSKSNASAVAMIDLWPAWQAHALIVAGPEGAGKSHLAHVWQLRSAAEVVSASDMGDQFAARLQEKKTLIVEDVDRGLADERSLFHALNLAREHGGHILLTARTLPGSWSVVLPDLRSRLRAAPLVTIEPPDDDLLAAVLVKLLSDRQLPATPHAVTHLARHMDRSMASALRLVEEIDRCLWQEPRKEITRAFASRMLANLSSGTQDADTPGSD